LRRLSRLFAEASDSVLQELVNTAVEFCGADGAGISLEEPDNKTFRWIVVAGSFSKYLNGRTPRSYSPCGTCLDAGRPQLFRVSAPYYDFLHVTADPVVDGLLIPWSNELQRGTLWAVSHESKESFCAEDYQLLSGLADFASIILRSQRQQELLRESERNRAAAEMANKLAHRINNPLQSLTNAIFLARHTAGQPQPFLDLAETELKRLSQQIAQLLKIT
jgi:signal transduction histidine kinase